MKQYFTMNFNHPLSASSTQTNVGARYLRHGDAIWELPTARYVTGMLNEHGMQKAKTAVTLAVNRNDGDNDSEEASAEEHRSLRRVVDKSQFLAPRRPDIAFATNRLAKSLACPSKSDIIATLWCVRVSPVGMYLPLNSQAIIQQLLNLCHRTLATELPGNAMSHGPSANRHVTSISLDWSWTCLATSRHAPLCLLLHANLHVHFVFFDRHVGD